MISGARTRTGADSPPLGVWMAVVCLLLVTVVSYKFFFEHSVENFSYVGPEFVVVNGERLMKFSASGDAGTGGGRGRDTRLQVVSLGTSLTKYATYSEQNANPSEAELLSINELNLLNISCPDGRLIHFSPLWDHIIASRPDFILIHDDLLSANYDPRDIIRRFIKGWLRSMFGGGDPLGQGDRVGSALNYQVNRVDLDPSPGIVAQRIALLQRRYEWRPDLSPEFIALAHQARQEGIGVAVVHLSRQNLFRVQYLDALRGWLAGLGSALASCDDIPLWVSPTHWEEDDYYDSSHLNDQGRDRFMGWLLSKLQAVPEEASDQ